MDEYPSPPSSSKSKRDRIVANCKHYRQQLKKWEEAVLKTEGRKPGKEDLKNAPESIQNAYKKYYKLAKYLETTSSKSPTSNRRSTKRKSFTPIKIFNERERSFKNLGLSNNVTSHLASTSRQKESTPLATTSKNVGFGFNYNRFSEKIFSAVNIFSKEPPVKPHKIIKVIEEGSGQEVTRKALIPTRFAEKQLSGKEIDSSIEKTPEKRLDASDTSGNSSLFIDELEAADKNVPDSGGTSLQLSLKLNSISGIWQNLSPSPKSSSKNGLNKSMSLKHVDSGWLERCGEVDKNNQNCSESEILFNVGAPQVEIKSRQESSEGLFASDFQRFLLNSKPVENVTDTFGMDCIGSNDPDSIDSGIGVDPSTNFILSSADIQDVIMNEVLPVTSSNSVGNDEIFFHNDNACPVPEASLQTIDFNAVTDILKLDTSHMATDRSVSPKYDEDEQTRKRTYAVAFSPSPEKPEPKKKFFKSSRSHVKKLTYTVNSYKPPTPSKKKPVKAAPIIASKVSKDSVINPEEVRHTHSSTTKANLRDAVDADEYSATVSNVTSSNKPFESLQLNSSDEKLEVKGRAASNKKVGKISRPVSKKTKNSSGKRAATKQPASTEPSSKASSSAFDKGDNYFDEATYNSGNTTQRKGKKRIRQTAKEVLDSKISNGKVNDNYVRIDITKKVFVRGHKKISGAKCKRNDWKLKRAAASKEDKLKGLTCKKCQQSGHIAKFCMKDTMGKEGPEEVDDSPFPTLEEAARMINPNRGTIANASSTRTNIYASNENAVAQKKSSTVTESVENDHVSGSSEDIELNSPVENCSVISSQSSEISAYAKIVPPYFGSGLELCSQEKEESILKDALKTFGYDEYRSGQMETIARVLKGLSTLVILSTGTGKSLCYQLPAYLYAKKNPGALALCVSPLVSLMEDQVQGVSPLLQAACLHSNMAAAQKEKVLEKIRSKKLHVLLVSPEAVCSGLYGLLRGAGELPLISFACIDEVHCISQWSHNFRPSYLQLAKILREKLNVKTILGLTATATDYTANNICDHLEIDPSTIIRGEIIPANLNLSVSRDLHRDESLLELLRGERFQECESIIIYCTRRDECQRIACLIRTNLQDIPAFNGVIKGKQRQRLSNNCEAYHAGMTAGRRRLVQQEFMAGKIRIVVATVAFGMGIDKSDIRAVIHYNMPKTFESYVQEIGRAGRDGLPAHCHLFLESVKGRDLSELRRHVYSNSVDRPTLRKLLRKIFQPCKCSRIAELSKISQIAVPQNETTAGRKRCPGHEVSFNINETVTAMDLPQENITTLLCYLELDKKRKWVEMLPHTYETCKIHSYGGPKLLKSCAMRCPPLAAAIALKREKKQFKESDMYLEFNVIEVASTLGWNSGIVKKELKNLEWAATNFDGQGNSTKFRKSGMLVEFCDLAFHLNAPGDLSDEEADAILDYLHHHNLQQEKSQLYQLNRVYQALLSISCKNVFNCSNECDTEKSEILKKFIHNYFTQDSLGIPTDWKNETVIDDGKEDEIRRDVADLVFSVRDVQFTGRAVAKIFQGIPSPCFPSEYWARNRAFWRKHIDVDFNHLCRIAGEEIIRLQ